MIKNSNSRGMTRLIRVAAVLLALSVLLGAVGAHALPVDASEKVKEVWGKAVLYHLIHGMALLILPLLAQTRLIAPWVIKLVWGTMLCGLLLFSGSLYWYALTSAPEAVKPAPFGGMLLILSWILLAVLGGSNKCTNDLKSEG